MQEASDSVYGLTDAILQPCCDISLELQGRCVRLQCVGLDHSLCENLQAWSVIRLMPCCGHALTSALNYRGAEGVCCGGGERAQSEDMC